MVSASTLLAEESALWGGDLLLGLQAGEKVGCALGVRGGREDGALVFIQHRQ
jgi:hypothetical protein